MRGRQTVDRALAKLRRAAATRRTPRHRDSQVSCLSCGKRISGHDEVVELHGVTFHRRCSTYRS